MPRYCPHHISPFERRGDNWEKLNLQLVADTASLAGGRPLAAFVQAPVSSLTSGQIAAAAVDYASAGVDRAFLRVAGFHPQDAGVQEVRAYRQALDAFTQAGIDAVADSVGRFGLVLAAAGATGFSCGAMHHHYVSSNPLVDADEIFASKMEYEVPDRWFTMARDQARVAAAAGLVPACPVAACAALRPGSASSDLKEHLVHLYTGSVRDFATAGSAATLQHLAANPRGANAMWSSAL